MNETRWFVGVGVAFALHLMFSAADARAQGSTPAPFSRVTISPEAAKRTLTKAQINATTARALVDACVDIARAANQTVAIYVLAPNGDVVDAHSMDGVLPIGNETGMLKAKTVLYARSSSGVVAQRFSTVDGRLIRLDLGKESGLAYYFVAGGLPIVVEDQLIGAIGVGGGAPMGGFNDENCAYEAMKKVLGPQPPLPQAPAPAAAPGGGPGTPAAPVGGRQGN